MSLAMVIVAAGSGQRLGGGVPKQYRPLAGRPLLRRTLDACLASERVEHVVCVIDPDHRALYDVAVPPDSRLLPPVPGGASRQASVKAGLDALADRGVAVVLIHDAARPFLTPGLIERIAEAAEPGTGALPGLRVSDTLSREEDGLLTSTVARENLWRAQTPQGFSYADITAAHERADADAFTDDAGLARAAGLNVRLVEGDARNVKITTSEDFAMAEAALAFPDIRVGHGYDTHRLVDGDRVWLCGVHLPHDRALDGHSDADVGLHALTDALLATVGAGDIGDHFPPSDPQWRGTASHVFLSKAVEIVGASGGRITHADVTLVCEAPKIGPHRDAMRERMADILGIEVSRVSVKATTNEERGFVGRNEGIVALATATVVMA